MEIRDAIIPNGRPSNGYFHLYCDRDPDNVRPFWALSELLADERKELRQTVRLERFDPIGSAALVPGRGTVLSLIGDYVSQANFTKERTEETPN
jgi:hypothetical protein